MMCHVPKVKKAKANEEEEEDEDNLESFEVNYV